MTRTISEEETELLLYWILGSKLDMNEETRAKTFRVALDRARQWLSRKGDR